MGTSGEGELPAAASEGKLFVVRPDLPPAEVRDGLLPSGRVGPVAIGVFITGAHGGMGQRSKLSRYGALRLIERIRVPTVLTYAGTCERRGRASK